MLRRQRLPVKLLASACRANALRCDVLAANFVAAVTHVPKPAARRCSGSAACHTGAVYAAGFLVKRLFTPPEIALPALTTPFLVAVPALAMPFFSRVQSFSLMDLRSSCECALQQVHWCA